MSETSAFVDVSSDAEGFNDGTFQWSFIRPSPYEGWCHSGPLTGLSVSSWEPAALMCYVLSNRPHRGGRCVSETQVSEDSVHSQHRSRGPGVFQALRIYSSDLTRGGVNQELATPTCDVTVGCILKWIWVDLIQQPCWVGNPTLLENPWKLNAFL